MQTVYPFDIILEDYSPLRDIGDFTTSILEPKLKRYNAYRYDAKKFSNILDSSTKIKDVVLIFGLEKDVYITPLSLIHPQTIKGMFFSPVCGVDGPYEKYDETFSKVKEKVLEWGWNMTPNSYTIINPYHHQDNLYSNLRRGGPAIKGGGLANHLFGFDLVTESTKSKMGSRIIKTGKLVYGLDLSDNDRLIMDAIMSYHEKLYKEGKLD